MAEVGEHWFMIFKTNKTAIYTEQKKSELVQLCPVPTLNAFLIQNVCLYDTYSEPLTLDNSFLSRPIFCGLKNVSFQGKLRTVDLFLLFFPFSLQSFEAIKKCPVCIFNALSTPLWSFTIIISYLLACIVSFKWFLWLLNKLEFSHVLSFITSDRFLR